MSKKQNIEAVSLAKELVFNASINLRAGNQNRGLLYLEEGLHTLLATSKKIKADENDKAETDILKKELGYINERVAKIPRQKK